METSQELLRRVRAFCAERGINLVGVVDRASFDGCQPPGRRAADVACPETCGSILVLASGGRALWEVLSRRLGDEQLRAREGHDPIDDWSEETARLLLDRFRDAGLRGRVVLPSSPCALNFVQLGELGGLGSVSPVIHQLLHPTFGPWVSLRAAVLLDGRPFGSPRPEVDAGDFAPCEGCAQPCREACPVDVYGADGSTDLGACARHRIEVGECATGCEVRRNCWVGAEHRYGAAEEAFRHAYSGFMMRAARASRGGRGLRSLLRRIAATLRSR